jgi:ankyrin repeat protein
MTSERAGYVGIAERFIAAGLHSNVAVDGRRNTALMMASRTTRIELIESLLTAGACINTRNTTGYTALHWAVEKGRVTTVACLVRHGADYTDEHGVVALRIAARTGCIPVLRYLLEIGLDINGRGADNCSAVQIAYNHRQMDTVTCLLSHGADPVSVGGAGVTLLMRASSHGQLTLIGSLLTAGACVNTRDVHGEHALYYALKNDQVATVKYLLEHGADCATKSATGATPMAIAVQAGYVPMLVLLIAAGVDVNHVSTGEYTPLRQASHQGQSDVVLWLLDHGADPTHSAAQATALHDAALNAHCTVARHLLTRGAPVAVRNDQGCTPLHLAASSGSNRLVQLLLKYQAPVSLLDYGGRTPLMLAVDHGHHTVVRSLLRYGATVHDCDFFDARSALVRSVLGGSPTITEILLRHGACPATRDADGINASEYARMASTVFLPGCMNAVAPARNLNPGKVYSRACAFPGCPSTEQSLGRYLQRCAQCRRQVYCSAACQLDHWTEHRRSCDPWLT